LHGVQHLGLTIILRLVGQVLGVVLGSCSLVYAVRRQRSGHNELEHVTEHESIELRLAKGGARLREGEVAVEAHG